MLRYLNKQANPNYENNRKKYDMQMEEYRKRELIRYSESNKTASSYAEQYKWGGNSSSANITYNDGCTAGTAIGVEDLWINRNKNVVSIPDIDVENNYLYSDVLEETPPIDNKKYIKDLIKQRKQNRLKRNRSPPPAISLFDEGDEDWQL